MLQVSCILAQKNQSLFLQTKASITSLCKISHTYFKIICINLSAIVGSYFISYLLRLRLDVIASKGVHFSIWFYFLSSSLDIIVCVITEGYVPANWRVWVFETIVYNLYIELSVFIVLLLNVLLCKYLFSAFIFIFLI